MLKSALLLSLATSLIVGCSTAPQPNPDLEPYCYTSEDVKISGNSVVDSTTRLECSDNPNKRAKLVGVDPKSCRSWSKRVVIRGTTKELYGFLCRDENGNWRPLDQF
jgi:hypothetical protein